MRSTTLSSRLPAFAMPPCRSVADREDPLTERNDEGIQAKRREHSQGGMSRAGLAVLAMARCCQEGKVVACSCHDLNPRRVRPLQSQRFRLNNTYNVAHATAITASTTK